MKGNEYTIYIDVKNKREAKFYFDELIYNDKSAYILPPDSFDESPSEFIYSINKVIQKHINENDKRIHRFIDDTISKCKRTILPDEDFKWLKKSERAAYFIWNLLMLRDMKNENGYFQQKIIELNKRAKENSSVIFPINHLERVEWIICYFDDPRKISDKKKNSMIEFKSFWNNVSRKNISIDWLDRKDNAQCKWAWKYINSKIERKPVWIKPTNNTNEIYLACNAIIDFWQGRIDGLEMILDKMQRAWWQKKYRDAHEDMKAISVYIPRQTKKMLDAIAKNRRITLSAAIDEMIQDKYHKGLK